MWKLGPWFSKWISRVSRSLEDRFLRSIRRWISPEQRVVVALSGGGDSVALLRLALACGQPLTAAHIDHSLRPESDQDADFCRRLCAELGVPLETRKENVGDLARGNKASVEATGRQVRYRFLTSLGEPVLTGHTLEDQSETLLLRQLEGCGLSGLGGIHPVFETVYRPLLEFRRQELRDYLDSLGQAWLEDPSNRDDRPRAWVRAQLLPLMRSRNPQLDQALASLAGEARRMVDYLGRQARPFLVDPDRLPLEVGSLHPALRTEVIRLALKTLDGTRPDRRQIEQVEALFSAPTGRKVDIQGLYQIERGRDYLYFESLSRPRFQPLQIKAGVDCELPEFNLRLRWQRVERYHEPTAGAITLPALTQSCVLRVRLAGDRLRPWPRNLSKSLKKLFQETPLTEAERERIPILCCGECLLWVIGLWVDQVTQDQARSTPVWGLRAETISQGSGPTARRRPNL